jgi:molecular chaperone GrpE
MNTPNSKSGSAEQSADVKKEQSGTPSDDLAKERDSLRDRLARTQAEFENSRKRMERDQQEYREFALADALRSLLPALDSFDWALQSPAENLQEYRGGIELIRKQLQDALEKLGLQPISAKGESFDPRYHEAVEVVETDKDANNTVVEELRRGYKLGDRLLRPAMVVVADDSRTKAA